MTGCALEPCRVVREELAAALLVLGDLTAGDLMDNPCVHNEQGDCLEHLWFPAETDGPPRACPNIRARELLFRHPLPDEGLDESLDAVDLDSGRSSLSQHTP